VPSLTKYQALGNDYLVLEEADLRELGLAELTAATVRRLCDRHRGLGSDGILLRLASRDFRLRIFNPDGSEAEKSGNGLRIFARYLFDGAEVAHQGFDVHTAGGRVCCRVLEDGEVCVEMGRVTFWSSEIPVAGPRREVLDEPIRVAGRDLRFSAASIGNPHCVVPMPDPTAEDARTIGPLLENDSRFARRTNVQLLQVLDRSNVRIEIWERGAGYTLASGSSSCAAAAVARRLSLCDAEITVHMPGGSLSIVVSDAFEVRMTGPVQRVGTMVPDTSLWNDAPEHT